jgi:putative oxidoreductase
MRKLLYSSVGCRESVSLLLLRLVVGIAFLYHGWGKINNPTGWMGAEAPVPDVLEAAAAVAEFGGGIALILGILTRPFALALAATMATAASMVHISQGHSFVASKLGEPSWELAGVYFVCSLILLLSGAGRLSLDALLFGQPRPVLEAN